MPDWLDGFRLWVENKQGLMDFLCARCSGVLYININKDIDKISSAAPGTPAVGLGVPGVPEVGAGNTWNTEHQGVVFQDNSNDINAITPGTLGTPSGNREQVALDLTALPAPTLAVLDRLWVHFAAQGFQPAEAENLALATLGALMRRKGGSVAWVEEEAGHTDELGRAVDLVREVFGPETMQEGGD